MSLNTLNDIFTDRIDENLNNIIQFLIKSCRYDNTRLEKFIILQLDKETLNLCLNRGIDIIEQNILEQIDSLKNINDILSFFHENKLFHKSFLNMYEYKRLNFWRTICNLIKDGSLNDENILLMGKNYVYYIKDEEILNYFNSEKEDYIKYKSKIVDYSFFGLPMLKK